MYVNERLLASFQGSYILCSMQCTFLGVQYRELRPMKNTKFVVRVNRTGTHAPQYVQRLDRTPIQTTTNRKLALVMGRFTAEDAVKSLQNSRCNPELLSVRVIA
jgi:hypothetical protein